MSFLAPLFLLGALAVVGPIVFHLIRRTTRDRVSFSSLMFLRPTPPQLTKRSRIEHWLLLALRALALGLIALAFARPWWRSPAATPAAVATGGRTAVVLDTSASMRRNGLWPAALERAGAALREAARQHEVALFVFDRATRSVLGFDEWRSMDPAVREAELQARLAAVSPTWHGTDLATALMTAAEALAEGEAVAPGAPRRLVLISDLQQGSRLDALQAYDWPQGIELILETVAPARPGNAGLQLAGGAAQRSLPESGARLRLINAADSRDEEFQVGWSDSEAAGITGPAVEVHVPAGQSRLVTVPWREGAPAPGRLVLTGDAEPFDNAIVTAPVPQTRVSVIHFGHADAADPRHPLFFLQKALPQSPRLAAEVQAVAAADAVPREALDQAGLVVITEPVPDTTATAVRERLVAGTTVLVALNAPSMAGTLSALAGVGSIDLEEVSPRTYAMLAAIDFRHPLFAPFADPRFSDFSKIRFLRYRKFEAGQLPGARVPAAFDSGDPAVLEAEVGRGRLVVFTSGWTPTDSQLAVSSKFAPLLASVLDWSGASQLAATSVVVGDPVPRLALGMPEGVPVEVRSPDESSLTLAADAPALTGITVPGLHEAKAGAVRRLLPVTLDPMESRTAPLNPEDLERIGAPLAASAGSTRAAGTADVSIAGVETEAQQKLWRWFLVAAFLVLLLETLLAGRAARRTSTVAAAAP